MLRAELCLPVAQVYDRLPSHLRRPRSRSATAAIRVVASIAPLAKIEAYRKRIGWTLPWVSSAASDFNRDFGITTESGKSFGLTVFLRDSGMILRSPLTRGRHTSTASAFVKTASHELGLEEDSAPTHCTSRRDVVV